MLERTQGLVPLRTLAQLLTHASSVLRLKVFLNLLDASMVPPAIHFTELAEQLPILRQIFLYAKPPTATHVALPLYPHPSDERTLQFYLLALYSFCPRTLMRVCFASPDPFSQAQHRPVLSPLAAIPPFNPF